jgi:hypothetical protein
MMRKILFLFIALSTLAVAKSIPMAQVGLKMQQSMTGFDSSVSHLQMVLVDKKGKESIKEMKLSTLEGNDKRPSMALMEFISPKDVKGTKLLTHEIKEGNNRQWIYLPVLKRAKEIKSRGKSGAFMGSQFSYEDLGNQDYSDFDYSPRAQEVYEEGRSLYKGERTPKSPSTGYTKQIFYVDTQTFLLAKVEYVDRKDKVYKVATFDKYEKIKGIYRAAQITMKNLKNGKSTILKWLDDKINVGLTPKAFDAKALK